MQAGSSGGEQQVYFSDNAPTWEQLAEMVKAQQSQLGVNFSADPEQADTNPTALKRTFGQTGPIRVKFYRDHAAWCPYCQKVWLQLEEKRIPYIMEKVNMRCYGDKTPAFLKKVPSGLLPVIDLDGRIVTESTVIMQLLEDSFPEHTPLMPLRGSPQRQRAEALLRLERRLFSDWMGWLTSDWNPVRARQALEATLDVVEQELLAAGGPFFLGEDLSLVDITFTSILERTAASLAYYKGFPLRGTGRWPALERWFNALEARPTYLGTRSDYYTHAHDLPPQLGGCAMSEQGVPVAAAIDGTNGQHWRLPLAPLSATSQPEPYSPGEWPASDRLEAAARLVNNHAGITRFACRGPGKPGPRPVSAPLADPTAIPDLSALPATDAALRHVAHMLLVGVEAKAVSTHALQVSSSKSTGAHPADAVIAGAEYLRDRVGVPRDMKFPAARQLRAHLNEFMAVLSPA
ncbi:MAG: hypothetical protein WDW36_005306 [Sanguina aurantia]